MCNELLHGCFSGFLLWLQKVLLSVRSSILPIYTPPLSSSPLDTKKGVDERVSLSEIEKEKEKKDEGSISALARDSSVESSLVCTIDFLLVLIMREFILLGPMLNQLC